MGHLTRHNPFIANIMEGRINSLEERGTPKTYIEKFIGIATSTTDISI